MGSKSSRNRSHGQSAGRQDNVGGPELPHPHTNSFKLQPANITPPTLSQEGIRLCVHPPALAQSSLIPISPHLPDLRKRAKHHKKGGKRSYLTIQGLHGMNRYLQMIPPWMWMRRALRGTPVKRSGLPSNLSRPPHPTESVTKPHSSTTTKGQNTPRVKVCRT